MPGTVNCLKFDKNACESVCVYVCNIRAKMFKAFAIYFSVYLGYALKPREKVIFWPNYFGPPGFNSAIPVIINKAFKLFQLSSYYNE